MALLCVDHQRLIKENSLFSQKILALEELNKMHQKTDSIKSNELVYYKNKSASDDVSIAKLKKSKKRIIVGSSMGGIIILTLIGILK